MFFHSFCSFCLNHPHRPEGPVGDFCNSSVSLPEKNVDENPKKTPNAIITAPPCPRDCCSLRLSWIKLGGFDYSSIIVGFGWKRSSSRT